MIEIDGSFGEGGGQMLRTALGMSCLTGKPFRMINIRKGRKNPGLMPQHLACVNALQGISRAETTGAHKGSTETTFSPAKVKAGEYFFNIATAGSALLVLQAVVPALIFAEGRSEVVIRGGTHVPFSPSFNYVSEVFAAMLEKIGVRLEVELDSYGFYPKGGGTIRARIYPAKKLGSVRVLTRGIIKSVSGFSCSLNLPVSIAQRQRNAAEKKISSALYELPGPFDIEAAESRAFSTGTFIFIRAESENSVAGFAALGERGKRAEVVGEEAAGEFIDYYRSEAAVDPHLADQLVPYLALCDGESAYTSSRITQHLLTNLWVTQLFHEFESAVEGEKNQPGKVVINGRSLRF